MWSAHNLAAAPSLTSCACTSCCYLQVITQLFLLLLLWGPNAGGLLLISDVAQKMMDALVPAGAAAQMGVPEWLLSGQAFMVAVTLLVSALDSSSRCTQCQHACPFTSSWNGICRHFSIAEQRGVTCFAGETFVGLICVVSSSRANSCGARLLCYLRRCYTPCPAAATCMTWRA